LNHFKENGLSPPEKKSGGRQNNKFSFKYQDIERVVKFLTNYADENAHVLPGRVPGFKRDDIKLIPSAHTKILVYNNYKEVTEKTQHRVMGSSSFFEFWQKLCPFTITAKPMTDLCWICQKNNNLIFRSANLSDENKKRKS
jgi:hypothetical protein